MRSKESGWHHAKCDSYQFPNQSQTHSNADDVDFGSISLHKPSKHVDFWPWEEHRRVNMRVDPPLRNAWQCFLLHSMSQKQGPGEITTKCKIGIFSREIIFEWESNGGTQLFSGLACAQQHKSARRKENPGRKMRLEGPRNPWSIRITESQSSKKLAGTKFRKRGSLTSEANITRESGSTWYM